MKRLIILTAVLLVASSLLLALLGGDRVPVDDLVAATEEFLGELNDYEELSLAVMISKNGVPVLEKAYGPANRSFDVPNRIDTKFNIASMNKMFTAVAVMQLVQSGKLRLDDTIGDHIPDFPNAGIKKVVKLGAQAVFSRRFRDQDTEPPIRVNALYLSQGSLKVGVTRLDAPPQFVTDLHGCEGDTVVPCLKELKVARGGLVRQHGSVKDILRH